MSQAGSENFPVASRVLPRAVRPHLLAVYGFARLVDDIGDEYDGDRLGELDWAEHELERAAAGTAEHPVFRALTPTIAGCDLSLQPLRDLIEANRQDQVVTRYETFAELTGYCMLSAAPVGRLVLAILGRATAERVERSDRVCIGLQLVEHLQDVAEDWAMGRLYLPLADLAAAGCPGDDPLAPGHRGSLRRTIAHEVDRARWLLADGAPLAASLPMRARLAIAAFSAGGAAALDAIERASFDVVAVQCRPKPSRFASRWMATLVASAKRGTR
ncbi:MAG: squalene synthase HpnC [Acidimicrobiales bacterium]